MNPYPVTELTHFCNISVKKCTKIPENKINYYDFTFVLEGSMTYIIDGKRITLSKNDAIFLKPGTIRARDTVTCPVAFTSFNFHAQPDVTFPFESYMPKCINENIRKLVHVFPGAHCVGFAHAQEKCTNMLNYILFELMGTVSTDTNNVHIAQILKTIDTQILNKVTLHTISKDLCLSKEHVSSLFRKEMGKTLTAYINERKMLLARDYILSGEMSLSEISAHLGFDNYNYFSRLFKKQFEMTPMAFKQKCK
ncbi:MAG: helix-turn-helix transcriptional regulator [Clostridia bacterium]|nr:helix-turn-helix transcriptional regulator [Clostridia bacterium]